ncbi:hypothetical protein HY491_01605 [Candidatus Woesearchaeota archaeon]|nr:hypothetical protein [Candidatus Woesearchaeota archaeon]
MEQFQAARDLALQKLKIADHMLTAAYRARSASVQEMQQLIGKARVFIQEITNITNTHEYLS